MDVRCQCGACHLVTPLPAPEKIYHCHCSECRRQSSTAFGTSAIFPRFPLPLDSQPIAMWSRPTSTGGTMYCFFCKTCGSRLVHQSTDKNGNLNPDVSVKAGCIEGLDWTGGEHIYCGDMVVKSIEIPSNVIAWIEDDDGPRWTASKKS